MITVCFEGFEKCFCRKYMEKLQDMNIIKEQQTEVINIKCYHDNLHAYKRINQPCPTKAFFNVKKVFS